MLQQSALEGWYSAEYTAEIDAQAVAPTRTHRPQSPSLIGKQRYGADHVDAAAKYGAQDHVARRHASVRFAPKSN